MASDKDGQLENLFSKLHTQIKNVQRRKALKTLDEILKVAPKDVDALQCKAVTLVESSRFQDALDLLQKHKLEDALAFEKAYCLYRLGRMAEALEAAGQVQEERIVGRLQLEAQLHYRMGHNAEAIKIYSQLFQKHKVTSLELRTNVIAAYVSGNRAAELPAVMEAMKIAAKDGFEIAFNKACGLLEMGDLAGAQEQLHLAQRQGRETLFEEDLSEEQVEEELAPLAVQLAFVAGCQGKHAEAMAAYEELIKAGIEDEATFAVAQNNALVEKAATLIPGSQQQKRFTAESAKKLESLVDKSARLQLTQSLETRLSDAQKECIHCNRALLLLLAHKTDACREIVTALLQRYPGSSRVAMLHAALLSRDGRHTDADAILSKLAASQAEEALQPRLMRTQMLLAQQQPAQALTVLASVGDIELQHRPAVVATRVTLAEQVGDVAGAVEAVEEALGWWKGSMRDGAAAKAEARLWLLQQLAQLQLKAGMTEQANSTYQELRSVDPNSPACSRILGQLARTSAQADPANAIALEKQLPPIGSLAGIDVGKLESAAVGSTGFRKQKGEDGAARKRPAGDVGEAPKEKKRRKKKIRLPKGFDPENPGPPPDPERWLPKWQRSDFKKKRNRRKDKEPVKGSQGAGKVDESLDRTNVEPEAAPAAQAKPAVRPPQRQGKGKGKGKGRR
ncbi:hypothetical protein WJX72_007419 [[Myrmecia] bisecta]|uniref:Signal recognition particle subunit SRP72 n=1 Tax=[Myrmecia] bisecta TaxID=41462 RepID=A0AAW1QFL9_9CHLO